MACVIFSFEVLAAAQGSDSKEGELTGVRASLDRPDAAHFVVPRKYAPEHKRGDMRATHASRVTVFDGDFEDKNEKRMERWMVPRTVIQADPRWPCSTS